MANGEAGRARARVLILVENLSVPADRRVWAESRSLVRAGYDVTVICPAGRTRDTAGQETIEGVSIHRFPQTEAGSGAVGYLSEYGRALWHMRRLARRLEAEAGRFEVVHLCNPPDVLYLAVGSLRRHGARVVFDHHDLVPELSQLRFHGRLGDVLQRATRFFERRTLRAADVVLCPNESYRRIAIERGGKRREDTFVVRIAPDLERFRPGEPDPELKRGKPHLIAYLGTMGHQDGVDHALRSLALLRRKRQDWHAVLAGSGDAADDLRVLARELALNGVADFAGHLDDDELLRLLSTADVCLSPEPKNGLNDHSTMIKVVEYMALARPIVAFELVETRFSAGDAAVYATPNSDEEFAGWIDRLLDDPGARAEMGARGRARVERELSWAHSERELLAAYERALASR